MRRALSPLILLPVCLALARCGDGVRTEVVVAKPPHQVGKPVQLQLVVHNEPEGASYRWATQHKFGYFMPQETRRIVTEYWPEQHGEHQIVVHVLDGTGREVDKGFARFTVAAAAASSPSKPRTEVKPPNGKRPEDERPEDKGPENKRAEEKRPPAAATSEGQSSAIASRKIESVSSSVPTQPPIVRILSAPPRRDQRGAARTEVISGDVSGIDTPEDYRVVVYAKDADGRWLVQPQATAFMTQIRPDMTWTSETSPGTDYSAWLLKASMKDTIKPIISDALPRADGHILAMATVPAVSPVAQKPETPTASTASTTPTLSTSLPITALRELTRELDNHKIFLEGLCAARNKGQFFQDRVNSVSIASYDRLRDANLPTAVKQYYDALQALVYGDSGTGAINIRIAQGCRSVPTEADRSQPHIIDALTRARSELTTTGVTSGPR
jgi:hypothetical protein